MMIFLSSSLCSDIIMCTLVSLSFHMQNWNAYIGRLGRKDFCFNISKSEISEVQLQDVLNQSSILGDSGNREGRDTVGVIINFTVDKAVLHVTPANGVLHGTFTGKDFTTQIRGRYTLYLKYHHSVQKLC